VAPGNFNLTDCQPIATSKVALNQLTRHLAAEISGSGVTANVIHPGDVKTDMWADIRDQANSLGAQGAGYRQWVEWVAVRAGLTQVTIFSIVAAVLASTVIGVFARRWIVSVSRSYRAALTSLEEKSNAVRDSEERYRLVVNGATEYAIFLLDPDGRVLSWNCRRPAPQGVFCRRNRRAALRTILSRGGYRRRQAAARAGDRPGRGCLP
jgi:hypothetical protein